MFVWFRLYLKETAMHMFNGKSGTMFYCGRFILCIVVIEKLVYEGPGGSIEDKYP
ncbi:hypothetical protein C7475_107257 [Chitinophaga sp. S165]|nr:hypothetical protein C7475_107257 [Chitinophaga sp. S165]